MVTMIPTDFTEFFAVMAGVGATLFGLIFVAVSIKPESTIQTDNPTMQQVDVASSYTALLNPLVISLIALVPHSTVGLISLIMSSIALINTFVMIRSLLSGINNWREGLHRGVFSLGSLLLFGFEMNYAIRLTYTPTDLHALEDLTTFLVIIYLYGIARAWDLLGARQFHIQELLFSSRTQKNQE